ncbi:MAG: ABC transporter substrate-binding protein [Candidatus Rokubacteria bacterium]|nr:ABC transporter substrate-binding protein [Candidatus Rokubacteria bacterium]
MTVRTAAIAVGLALAVAYVAPAAEAQQTARMPRIGWLAASSTPAGGGRYLAAFRRGLHELGYVEGTSVIIETRTADGRREQLPDLAAQLVRSGVQVIVALDPPATRAALNATSTVPVVARFSDDPVAAGLVKSLAHPGGNVTGVTSISGELYGKRLELLKEALPAITRVSVLINSRNSSSTPALAETRAAASRLGIQIQVVNVGKAEELEGAFRLAREQGAEALVPLRNPVFVQVLPRLVTLAAEARLPAIYDERAFADAGGLMTFGANLDDLDRRAAGYVDKILKGARPGDLPVEQPTTFELIVNLKTAKALGVTIPRSLLLRADTLIQ